MRASTDIELKMYRVLGAPADRSGGGLPWPDEIQVWRNRARVGAFARNVSERLSPRSVRVGARVAADNRPPRGVDRNRYGFGYQSRPSQGRESKRLRPRLAIR